MLLLALAVVTLSVLYWFPLRRWFSRWGTTPDERQRAMTGDALIEATHVTTHAITIDAPAEDIWPWLVQIGYQRGGLYSYDWLDRLFGFLDRPSANEILPEFQQLATGDTILLGPHQQMAVVAIEPLRALVLKFDAHGFEWVWELALVPVDDQHTRFISRGSERVPKSVGGWIGMRMMEPAAFIMTRRMLLGVKKRAEARRRQERRAPADSATARRSCA